MILVRYGPDGTPIDSLGGVPEAVMGIVPIMGAGSLQIERSGPRTRTGGSAEGAWIGTARRHEVAFWPVDGRPALLLRWPGRRLNLTEADRSAIEELTRQWTRDDPSLAETYEAWPITRSFPSYDRLVSDDSGGVWVRLYRRPGEDGPASWLAFDEEGRLRARIASPSDLQIVEVGVDAVLGRRQDALGVEHVVRLGLSRSGAPSGGPGARPPSM